MKTRIVVDFDHDDEDLGFRVGCGVEDLLREFFRGESRWSASGLGTRCALIGSVKVLDLDVIEEQERVKC